MYTKQIHSGCLAAVAAGAGAEAAAGGAFGGTYNAGTLASDHVLKMDVLKKEHGQQSRKVNHYIR